MQNNFKIRTLIKQFFFTKYHFFNEIAPNLTSSQKSYFLKFNWIFDFFFNQPLLPYEFHGSGMWGMYFFIFCQLWASNSEVHLTQV